MAPVQVRVCKECFKTVETVSSVCYFEKQLFQNYLGSDVGIRKRGMNDQIEAA